MNMVSPLNLLVETPDFQSFEYILEEDNLKKGTAKNLFIKGPYILAGEVNRNKRIYDIEEVVNEVDRYDNEMIRNKRALGELNHPTTAEVDLERACHMVTELKANDGKNKVYVGKSKVLVNTPMGKIVAGLIQDGVQVGVSTRSLGKLIEEDGGCGISKVQDLRLVAIDVVADPSFPKALVNGILESKQFICSMDGKFEEYYEKLERSLQTLPKHNTEQYLREQVLEFIKKLV